MQRDKQGTNVHACRIYIHYIHGLRGVAVYFCMGYLVVPFVR